ncbi:MAG: ATP-binding protein [Desulfobacteraceae bacterium]|jgi:hypothetical protein|nr:MAG: ATP-binding protein [Desulfobacteraceae bacterium]
MRIDDVLIESLLYEEEGVDLDLKSDQYRFTRASDDEKSELLKDILAFANAWRHADAFILIGVKEIKGGRSEVVGISATLDDAAIQQFVNNKTQRPITFSYSNSTFESKQIAVIHIPLQQRPFYLKRDFGRLKKETVYVRRGSSTDIATLDEISRIGAHSYATAGAPELSVSFADPSDREWFSTSIQISSLYLKTPRKKDIPDYRSNHGGTGFGLHMTSFDLNVNSSYYRELIEYTKKARLMEPVFLAVKNSGTSTAHDVRAELKFPIDENRPTLQEDASFPEVPSTESVHLRPRNFLDEVRALPPDVSVNRYDRYWLVVARAEKVQPKSIHWFRVPFFFGSKKTGSFDIEVTIYCDDLSEPTRNRLSARVESETREIDLKGILELEHERFRNTPYFKRILAEREGEQEQE